MTKTSPFIHPLSNFPFNWLNHDNISSHSLNHGWWLRRTKPNSTTKNLSILLNCPYRMNGSYHYIQPQYYNSELNHLYLTHNSHIHNVYSVHKHYYTIPITDMKQDPINSNSYSNYFNIPRRPPSTNRLYPKMNHHSRTNKKWQHHYTHNNSYTSPPKPLLLLTPNLLFFTNNIPNNQQLKNKMTIWTNKTYNIYCPTNYFINNISPSHTHTLSIKLTPRGLGYIDQEPSKL